MRMWPLFVCCSIAITPAAVAGGAGAPVGALNLSTIERMTPAQLQRLSLNQIDDLTTVAGASIDQFLKTMLVGPLPGPVWPSADYTLYYSAMLSSDAWINSDYKKDAGADLTSNGCAFPVAAAYQKTFGANACRHQNFGYRNVAQYHRTHTEAVRKVLDMRFLLDMYVQCLDESTSPAGRLACERAAVAAYVQARTLGTRVFDAVQARYSNP
ncbi:phospholipase A2 [Deinococcus yavapaiensis]|uniref:Phospholipase A2-like protein n=1 Tax=Deinococcus yavapaiensis KR-236 TaxID=694435 RepID=A0A318SB95_9DEIO|nr:phospholipase A2 [Deinococcus yavapaiensis]PYE53899.1 phospholipase A2-like protein [Deinococcus yavapaiensis KR-236]